MRLLNRKSRWQRLLDSVSDSVDVPSKVKSGLPDIGSANPLKGGNPLKNGLDQGKALKAGLIAGGLAGLTAASAGVSSLRRRTEGARGDS